MCDLLQAEGRSFGDGFLRSRTCNALQMLTEVRFLQHCGLEAFGRAESQGDFLLPKECALTEMSVVSRKLGQTRCRDRFELRSRSDGVELQEMKSDVALGCRRALSIEDRSDELFAIVARQSLGLVAEPFESLIRIFLQTIKLGRFGFEEDLYVGRSLLPTRHRPRRRCRNG